MTPELSTSRAWPWGGAGWGARMRDSPAAAMIWRPLTEPTLQPRVARTQETTAIISRAKPERARSRMGSPTTRPSSMPVVAMIEAAKISPGRRVAEQEHGALEAPVGQPPAHAAQHIGDRRAQQQPDDRCVGTGLRVAADLESGRRSGQHEQETEALNEDHGATVPLGVLWMEYDVIVPSSGFAAER